MKRRSLVLTGAAVAAATAGVAWQRWQEPLAAHQQVGASPGLWALSFPKPDGSPLALSSLRGQPWVLNFWATWCPPCVKEMPELDRFARDFAAQGWRVLGLAVDKPEAVREFLGRSPVSYAIAVAGFEGADLSRQLGNQQGGLPFTVAFNRQGVQTHQKASATHFEELAAWAKALG